MHAWIYHGVNVEIRGQPREFPSTLWDPGSHL